MNKLALPSSPKLQFRAFFVTMMGQVRALLDNFDGDALGMWRTAGRMRSA